MGFSYLSFEIEADPKNTLSPRRITFSREFNFQRLDRFASAAVLKFKTLADKIIM
jgi:hypothetical protein